MQTSAGVQSETPRVRVLAAIVNHGSANVPMTTRAAASVLEQAADVDLAVVVLDSGSGADAVRELRSSLDRRAEVRAIAVNRGYGAAANEAIKLARARGIDLVWVLNNDLLVEIGALASLVSALQADKTLAAVVPVTVSDGSPAVVLGAGVDLSMSWARARHRHEGRDPSAIPKGVERVDAIEAAAALVRVAATASIGAFDERFFMYWEDTEWSVRARRAGWRLGVALDARVHHLVARSSTPADRAEFMIGNRVRFARTVLGRRGNVIFAGYMSLWLPAYAVGRLLPRFGPRRSVAIAIRAITGNLQDAARHGRWLVAPWTDLPPLGHRGDLPEASILADDAP